MKEHIIKIISFFLAFFLLVPTISYADDFGVNDIFTSYLVINADDGEVLGQYKEDEVLPIASITKLMTFAVVEDALENGSISLDTEVVITKDMIIPGSSFNLKEEEILTVDDLIKGMLVVSGNDAAQALALTVGGSEANFAKMMNDKAKKIGLETAVFYNSSGYPLENGKENEMSTKDISKMADYLVKTYPDLTEYTKIRQLDYPDREFKRKSSIPLLGEVKGVNGLKTGTTDKAGHCVVTTMRIEGGQDEKPYNVIIVAMGAKSKESRDIAIKKIAEYIRKNYSIVTLVKKDESQNTLKINSSENRNVKVYTDETVSQMVDKSKGINFIENLDPGIKAPFKSGEKIGKLTIMNGSTPIKEVDLIVKDNYDKAGIPTRIRRTMSWAFRLTRELLYV